MWTCKFQCCLAGFRVWGLEETSVKRSSARFTKSMVGIRKLNTCMCLGRFKDTKCLVGIPLYNLWETSKQSCSEESVCACGVGSQLSSFCQTDFQKTCWNLQLKACSVLRHWSFKELSMSESLWSRAPYLNQIRKLALLLLLPGLNYECRMWVNSTRIEKWWMEFLWILDSMKLLDYLVQMEQGKALLST